MKSKLLGKVIPSMLVLLIILVMSACGTSTETNSSNMPSSSETSAPVSTAAEQKEPVVLKMIEHSNGPTNDAIKVINAAFHEKYPYITVESTIVEAGQYAELRTSRIAANDVDIFEFSCNNITHPSYTIGKTKSASVELIEQGYVLDLTGQPFLSGWAPSALEQADSYDGKVYSLNIGRTAFNGIFYSKDIFSKYNLSEPKTWNELITICETLKSNGIAPMTSGAKDVWPTQMLWDSFPNAFEPDSNKFLEGLWTGERKFNDAKTLALFDKMAALTQYFENDVINVDYNTVISRFISGKAAMMPDGTWQAASIDAADPSFKYGYFALPGETAPADGGDVQLAGKYDIGYAGFAKTNYKEAVLNWLAFFSDKDIYAAYVNSAGILPNMDIPVENAFLNTLASKTKNFATNFQILYRAPTGVGKYAGFKINELSVLGGSIKTARDLADLAQKDWDDALTKVKAEAGVK